MTVPNLRYPVVSLDERPVIWRRHSSKFEFKFQPANRHWNITHRARRPCAQEAEDATRDYWHSVAADRFVGFFPDDWLVGMAPGMFALHVQA